LGYWVAVVTRNGADHLPKTLDSLFGQAEAPNRVTVVDDGSTDGTGYILRKYMELNGNLRVLTKPDRGYDIRRVPDNINQAWTSNADLPADYFMISGDDCTYPAGYADSLLARMQADQRLVVASGHLTSGGSQLRERSPSGSGRMVRSSFWRQVGSAYPLIAGWETWLLYKAAQRGFRVKLFDDLIYEHERPRGTGHQFVYWGAAMGTLGYHPLYAAARIARNGSIRTVGATGAMSMLRGYLQSQLGSDDPFILPFDKPLQKFVKNEQALRMQQIVAKLIRKIS